MGWQIRQAKLKEWQENLKLRRRELKRVRRMRRSKAKRVEDESSSEEDDEEDAVKGRVVNVRRHYSEAEIRIHPCLSCNLRKHQVWRVTKPKKSKRQCDAR